VQPQPEPSSALIFDGDAAAGKGQVNGLVQGVGGLTGIGELAQHAVIRPDRLRLGPRAAITADADNAVVPFAQHCTRPHQRAAVYRAAGQGFFALGYGGAIAAELYSALHGHASAGDLVLVITLAVQVSVQVSGALSVLSLLQVAARTTDRIGDLRAVAAAAPAGAANPAGVPGRLTRGITLEDVSFTYPGAERPVLAGVSVHIPAGSVLALVGENGAGKSTLVKLLCGLYQPTSGRILIDGQDLAGLDPARWRARIATLFQDFHRIELTLGESIGHGDIARAGDTEAVSAAAEKARADRVLRVVPGGLTGYVGHSYCDGTELSGGQWQTVGRFSTVGMADLIAVLDHGQLTECGTHRELMTAPGLYAELFTLQARAYH